MTIDQYVSWFKARYKRTSSLLTASAFVFSDFVAIMLCIGAGFFVVNAVDFSFINFKSFVNYWTYLPIFFVVYHIFKLYPGILLVPSEQLRSFTIANAFMFGGIALSIVVETDSRGFIAIAFLLAFCFSTFTLPLSRIIARKYVYSRFKWWGIPAVIYGKKDDVCTILDDLIDNPSLGYIPVAIIDETAGIKDEYRDIPVLNSVEDSKRLNTELHIKMAIIIPEEGTSRNSDHLLITTLSNFRYNIIIPKMNLINTISLSIKDINGTLGLATTHNLRKWYNMAIKIVLDYSILIAGSFIIIPLFCIISFIIKLTSPGPIFYGHERIGRNGKRIRVWKFRSMVTNADELLEKVLAQDPSYKREWEMGHKLSNDPRITGIGKFLRKSSLDELPQLFNIIRGDMSFIGPRPVTDAEIQRYGENFYYIFSVKPGLSGMWQVSGRSDTDYAERVAFDSYYIQNWSIWLDLWLIFKTIGVVLTGKGAR